MNNEDSYAEHLINGPLTEMEVSRHVHLLADGTFQDPDIDAATARLKSLAAHVEAEVARIAKECDMPFLRGTLHVGSNNVL